MTSYFLLTDSPLTADWAFTNHADSLGYELLGWVISPSSILPTPSPDHSTGPGGQSHSLLLSSGSLALWQATLWHHPCNMTGDTNKDTNDKNEANSSDEDIDKVTATMDVVLTVSAE